MFYVLHALIHVADLVTGRLDTRHWLIDMPGVFLPALFLVWLSMPARYRDVSGSVTALGE